MSNVLKFEADAPRVFRVALPGEVCVFSACVSLYLNYLDGKSVVHVVDKETKLRAACFLTGEYSRDVWESLVIICSSLYVGFPDFLATE